MHDDAPAVLAQLRVLGKWDGHRESGQLYGVFFLNGGDLAIFVECV